MIKSLADLEKAASEGARNIHPPYLKVMVGAATCGIASGANEVIAAAEESIKLIGNGAVVTRTGCIGMCYEEPLLDILKPGWPRLTYSHVKPEQVAGILEAVKDGKVIKEGLLGKIEEIEDITRNTHNTRNTSNTPSPDSSLFDQKEESNLWEKAERIRPNLESAIEKRDYKKALQLLLSLRPLIDKFFDEVFVMVADEKIRNNRLHLLAKVRDEFLKLADFSRIVVEG
ncbi:hypothetical protein KAX21_05165 [candidate division WOR-3 bacterium]|nr:hypothetical protein [candidate division WOR-3 bacterium]